MREYHEIIFKGLKNEQWQGLQLQIMDYDQLVEESDEEELHDTALQVYSGAHIELDAVDKSLMVCTD
jgi:hypothetical protein